MREFCVSMPGVEDVTDGSVDSFENDWVRESDQDCPTSCCGETQSRCRCAGCGGRGRCSCNSSSRCSQSVSRCSCNGSSSQSASRCSRSCSSSRACAGSAGAAEAAAVDWEEYEIVDE